jgi:lactate permease
VYRQTVDPLGHLALTAALAALPLLVLLVLLGLVRMKAHWAGLCGLLTAALVAVAAYRMPVGQVADSAAEGAAFGMLPIVWIILNAVWINKLQRASGHFDLIGRAFTALSGDRRVQALIIAYSFGAMIESLSGFGTPIAITSIILIGLGLSPLKAAAVAAFANTAPAAFGSVGNPIQALAKATGFSEHDLGAMVGRQSAVIAVLVPFLLLIILDGRRGLRQAWPAALVSGVGFGVGQFLCSNYFTYQLTDITAGVVSIGCLALLLRFWTPSGSDAAPAAGADSAGGGRVPAPASAPGGGEPLLPGGSPGRRPGPGFGSGGGAAIAPVAEAQGIGTGPRTAVLTPSRRETVRAFTPYALLVAAFAVVSVDGPVERFVSAQDYSFSWPGLAVRTAAGQAPKAVAFDVEWLGTAGSVLLIVGVLSALVLGIRPGRALRAYGEACVQIRYAALSIGCILALSYVMNLSGMALSLGTWLAGLGAAFAFFSGLLGWFGVALTGSDTSSNALFGAMQVTAAQHIGMNPLLAAATNSSGGVQGKAEAMQNLVIASSAVGLTGREGEILRKVIGWSLLVLAVLCVLALLQSTPVLSWMTIRH